jgi:hypothetical protein
VCKETKLLADSVKGEFTKIKQVQELCQTPVTDRTDLLCSYLHTD